MSNEFFYSVYSAQSEVSYALSLVLQNISKRISENRNFVFHTFSILSFLLPLLEALQGSLQTETASSPSSSAMRAQTSSKACIKSRKPRDLRFKKEYGTIFAR